jgi:hypothetical protein
MVSLLFICLLHQFLESTNFHNLGGGDEITIKKTKGLVDSQYFMYCIYFENVSHIIFKFDINMSFFTLCSFTHEVIIL